MLRLSLLASAVAASLMACGVPESSTSTTSSSQTCNQKHQCVNGACECTEGPRNGSSCCSPSDSSCTTNKCDTFCRYCQ